MYVMYYVYVLWTSAKRRFYIGWTGDLRRRIAEHNRGENTSTKYGRPWVVLYYEAYQSDSLAKQRERVLKKRGKVWQSLRARIVPDSA